MIYVCYFFECVLDGICFLRKLYLIFLIIFMDVMCFVLKFGFNLGWIFEIIKKYFIEI